MNHTSALCVRTDCTREEEENDDDDNDEGVGEDCQVVRVLRNLWLHLNSKYSVMREYTRPGEVSI